MNSSHRVFSCLAGLFGGCRELNSGIVHVYFYIYGVCLQVWFYEFMLYENSVTCPSGIMFSVSLFLRWKQLHPVKYICKSSLHIQQVKHLSTGNHTNNMFLFVGANESLNDVKDLSTFSLQGFTLFPECPASSQRVAF